MEINGIDLGDGIIRKRSINDFENILGKISTPKIVDTDKGYKYLDHFEISKEEGQYILKLVLYEVTQEQKLSMVLDKAKPLLKESLDKADDDTKQKYAILYQNYRDDKGDHMYQVGDLRSQYGILYRCKKAHKKDYQALPQLLGEYWELVKNKPDKPKNPNLPKEKPAFFEADKTYKVGDYVMFGDKVYQRINQKGSGGSPFSDPKNWQLIGKWED